MIKNSVYVAEIFVDGKHEMDVDFLSWNNSGLSLKAKLSFLNVVGNIYAMKEIVVGEIVCID